MWNLFILASLAGSVAAQLQSPLQCELNVPCTACVAAAGCVWCEKIGTCLQANFTYTTTPFVLTGTGLCGAIGGTVNQGGCSPQAQTETCQTYFGVADCTGCKARGCTWCDASSSSALPIKTCFEGTQEAASACTNPVVGGSTTSACESGTCYSSYVGAAGCPGCMADPDCNFCSNSAADGCTNASSSLCSFRNGNLIANALQCPSVTTGVAAPVTTGLASTTTTSGGSTSSGSSGAPSEIDTSSASNIVASCAVFVGATWCVLGL